MLSKIKPTRPEIAAALIAIGMLTTTGCAGPPPPPPPSPSPSTQTPSPPEDVKEELDLEPVDNASLSTAEETAKCLPGIWEIDKTSDYWDLPFGDADEASGTIFIKFDPVSGYVLEYDQVRAYTSIVGSPADVWVDVRWNGAATGEYVIGEDGVIETTEMDSGIVISTIQNFGDVREEDEIPAGQPFPMVYRCDGDQLFGFSTEGLDFDNPMAIYRISERIFE